MFGPVPAVVPAGHSRSLVKCTAGCASGIGDIKSDCCKDSMCVDGYYPPTCGGSCAATVTTAALKACPAMFYNNPRMTASSSTAAAPRLSESCPEEPWHCRLY